MTIFSKTTILSAMLFPGLALASVSAGDQVGTTEAEVLAFLTAEGYTIEEVETEGGTLEVEAMFGGAEIEIEIDLATGHVAEVELEDDDEDDD